MAIDREPLVAWQAQRLARAVTTRRSRTNQAWLNLAPGQTPPPGSQNFDRTIRDPVAFAGPMTGMAAALSKAKAADLVAFVPADMPLLEAAHLRRLFECLESNHALAGVMARWSSGPRRDDVEPFPSLWRAGPARKLLREAMAAGIHGPHRLASRPEVACVEIRWPRDAAAWSSINHPRDLRRAALRLGREITRLPAPPSPRA